MGPQFSFASRARLTICLGALLLALHPGAQAGSITGEVKFAGELPHRPPIKVTKDQDYCGQTVPNESYLVGPGSGVKNVVVYVDNPSRPVGTPVGEKERLLENHGCRFAPRILAMRLGEKLVVKNSDLKLHIVHSYAEKRTVFNLSLPFRGQKLEVTHRIKEAGLLQVNCDTHGWMRAYIHVFGHPFFAVTDERGSFAIADIPPGRYRVKAWHEEAGVRSAEVLVAGEGQTKVNFELGQ